MSKSLIIGVDFDGTIVEHEYPEIGRPVPLALETLRECINLGARVILWTMRSGDELQAAVDFLASHRVSLFGVNRNPETDWSTSPKAYCHVYVDDAAFGCPLMKAVKTRRPVVDWSQVASALLDAVRQRAAGVVTQW